MIEVGVSEGATTMTERLERMSYRATERLGHRATERRATEQRTIESNDRATSVRATSDRGVEQSGVRTAPRASDTGSRDRAIQLPRGRSSG